MWDFLSPPLLQGGPTLWTTGIENPALPLCGTLAGERRVTIQESALVSEPP